MPHLEHALLHVVVERVRQHRAEPRHALAARNRHARLGVVRQRHERGQCGALHCRHRVRERAREQLDGASLRDLGAVVAR